MADGVIINPGVGGDTIASDDIGGAKYQRVKLIHGLDGVNAGDVSTANGLPVQLLAGTAAVGTVAAPTLTKGAQGATGFSTQDLKDGGRTIIGWATAIAGVAIVNAEAMISMSLSADGAVSGPFTSLPITAAKRLRATGIMVGFIATAAAVVSLRVSLRMEPAGACTVTSPIILTIPLSSPPAVAQQGNEIFVPLPDGIEFSGTMQIGLSQVGSVAGGTLWASLVGFQY